MISSLRTKFNLLYYRLHRSLFGKPASEGSQLPQYGPSPEEQDLDLYWNEEMARLLETWGEKTVWKEIQFLLVNCKGKVLDVACGTGKTIDLLSPYTQCEIYGCDISDFLIQKALQRGIPGERLTVCDATQLKYEDEYFDYSYSIGSLEHFTESGIDKFVAEMHRVTKCSTFHMLPVSRSNRNEGWTKTLQSFHNNSVDWWMSKFKTSFTRVYVLDSGWEDKISIGKWFVCLKER